jgi:peptide/nickel transport system permease protein
LELIVGAAIISLLIALPAGVFAAVYRNGPFDRTVGVFTSFALSVPVFVTGTIFVLIFSQILRLVPTGNFVSFSRDPAQHLLILLMPSTTIALGLTAVLIRMMRSSTLEMLNRDWVRTARAKGLSEGRVLGHHVARNALSPVVTVLGLQLGALLGGTVLVEYVFNWPGLSGLLVNSVEQRDYPMVRGIVLVI